MNDLHQRAFRFLEHLAADLSKGEVSFPTFIDATVKVRLAVNDPSVTADRLARIISAEPLLSAKVVKLANSAALNQTGKEISDLKKAVLRVGFAAVRTTAVAVAMEQLVASKDLDAFRQTSQTVWQHSLDVAAISYVLARKLTKLNPDEAMFAGLVHDIGHFYLMSRASKYPELTEHSEELGPLLQEWHASVGHAVLDALGLPEGILKAVDEHELPNYSMPPRNMSDVLIAANVLTRTPNPLDKPRDPGDRGNLDEQALRELLDESELELKSIVQALKT
ncbi:MAG TPA: HDOD domain-containing protein [Rhodocyclaceae bacterium]|jgi:putative nucleotidyltransferase with HDIG domain|nr:HDOD domain-containing protein [Rhodocyclaceae bacterium]